MSTKRGRYAHTNKKRVSKFFDFVRDEKMTFFYSAATLFKHKTICSDFALDVNSSSKKKVDGHVHVHFRIFCNSYSLGLALK